MLNDKRIRIIIGHYGSGKTEFSVNYARELAKITDRKLALADLDIVNPYFRSRERAKMLENLGVEVISSQLGNNVNFDLPSLSAGILRPLQNEEYDLILDVGGDHVGARVLKQYKQYLVEGAYDMFAVVNANRPETKHVDGVLGHLKGIEMEAGLKVTGLINNTHLIWDTSVEDVMRGQELLMEVSDKLNIPIVYVSVRRELIDELPDSVKGSIVPVDMIMRDLWM